MPGRSSWFPTLPARNLSRSIRVTAFTLGAGAKLTVIEINKGEGVYWHNPVTDIVVGEGATFSHFRLQAESTEAFHLATMRAEIAGNGAYEAFTAVMGAKISRAEFHATLTGAQAHTHLNAAQLLRGTQHGDFTTVVRHQAPNCTSRQTVKSVLDEARAASSRGASRSTRSRRRPTATR